MTSFKTIPEILSHWSETTPKKTAISFIDDKLKIDLTYRELYEKVQIIAHSISEHTKQNDRVLVALPNRVEFLITFFACQLAKVICVPAYPPDKKRHASKLSAIFHSCTPSTIICDSKHFSTIEQMQLGKAKIFCPDDLTNEFKGKSDFQFSSISPNEVAFIQYTSGSTGSPKGVMLTHRNLITNLEMITQAMQLSADDIIISWLPLFHDMGLIGNVLGPIFNGATTIVFDPGKFIQTPELWMQIVSDYKGTVTGAPNFAFDYVVRKYSSEKYPKIKLDSLRLIYSGSEPINIENIDKFFDIFSKYGVSPLAFFPCYGLAEASLLVSGGPTNKTYNSKSFINNDGKYGPKYISCGRIAHNLNVRIVNSKTMRQLPPGEIGEILISGPNVSRGYWNNAVANSENFGIQISGDVGINYFRTGDHGVVHNDELYITGRSKEMIIRAGKNHFPSDIEFSIANKIPSIPQANIICAQMPEDGKIAVYIELGRHQLQYKFDEIRKTVRRATFEDHELRIDTVKFLGPGGIPRTTSGKPRRLGIAKIDSEGQLKELPNAREDFSKTEEQPAKTSFSPDSLALLEMKIKDFFNSRYDLPLQHERRSFSPNAILEFGNLGLLGMIIPHSYGGLGLNFSEMNRLIKLIASFDISAAVFIGLNNVLGIYPLLRHGSKSQKEQILKKAASGSILLAYAITEHSSGSNPKLMTTTAKESNSRLYISGTKRWIGSASWSSYINLFCKEYDREGKSLGYSCFIVDSNRNGIKFGPEEMTIGVRPIVQSTIKLSDYEALPNERLGNIGQGISIAFETMNIARMGLSAIAIGGISRALLDTYQFAEKRKIATGPLSQNGVFQRRLSGLIERSELLESYTDTIASAIDESQNIDEIFFLASKVFGPELLWSTLDDCLQFMGGMGYILPNKIAYQLMDARLFRIFEGPTEALLHHLGTKLTSTSRANWIKNGFAKIYSDKLEANLFWIDKYSKVIASTNPKINQIFLHYIGKAGAISIMMAIASKTSSYLLQHRDEIISELDSIIESSDLEQQTISEFYLSKIRDQYGQQGTISVHENWRSDFQKIENELKRPEKTMNRIIDDQNREAEEIGNFIREKLKQTIKGVTLPSGDNFELLDLGIDSLTAIELVVGIEEQFKLKLPDTFLSDNPDYRSIVHYIQTHKVPEQL